MDEKHRAEDILSDSGAGEISACSYSLFDF